MTIVASNHQYSEGRYMLLFYVRFWHRADFQRHSNLFNATPQLMTAFDP